MRLGSGETGISIAYFSVCQKNHRHPLWTESLHSIFLFYLYMKSSKLPWLPLLGLWWRKTYKCRYTVFVDTDCKMKRIWIVRSFSKCGQRVFLNICTYTVFLKPYQKIAWVLSQTLIGIVTINKKGGQVPSFFCHGLHLGAGAVHA